MMIKYRVHEVAKDLNVPSKDIITLLGKHFDTPKKSYDGADGRGAQCCV